MRVKSLKFLRSLRFHTTFALHLKAHKNSWYKEWHQWRFHHHFHAAMFVFYTVSVLLGSFATLLPNANNKALAAALNYDQTFDTGTGLTYDSSKINIPGDGLATLKSHTPGSDWIATDNDGGYNWSYRKAITITNPNATNDFQVQLTGIDTVLGGKVQANCSDMRFTSDNGVTVIPHWVESTSCPSASTTIWVKVPATKTTIYMYYGNSKPEWMARETNRTWRGVASSSDGTKLAAVVNGGQIYTSTDSGATWTPRDSSRAWWNITSSSDGTKLAATVNNGQIYTSTDSGATWTPRESSRGWDAMSSSSDGTKLAAAVWGGQIYISTDSGATWAARASSQNWASVSLSSDGTKIVATADSSQIYTTTIPSSDTAVFEDVISNVQGAWEMGDNPGGAGVDSSGNNLTSTLNGTAEVSDRNSRTAKARNYAAGGDGVDNITVSDNTVIRPTPGTVITLSVWARSGDNTDTSYIIKKKETYSLRILADGTINTNFFIASAWRTCSSAVGAFPETNTWTHLAVTYDTVGGSYKIYKNGTEVASCPAQTGDISSVTNTELLLGTYNFVNNDWNGDLDDIRVYNKVLPVADMQKLAVTSNISEFSTAHPNMEYVKKYTAGLSVGAPSSEEGIVYNDNPSIGNTAAINMSKLVGFTGTAGGGSTGTFEYQLSPDNGAHWYEWFEGDDWYEVTGSTSTIDQAAVDQFNERFATPDTAGYIQFKWRAVLISNGTLSQIPKLDEVTFSYYYDTADPDNVVQSDASYGGNSLNQASYYNYIQPIFDWSSYAPLDNNSGGGESNSGIDGYYVLFCSTALNNDTDCNPATNGYSTYTTGTTYTAPDMTGWTSDNYYLRIKTKDKAGNISDTTSVPFVYHFDVNKPTNPPTLTRTPYAPTDVQNNFRFDWSGATDPDPDGAGSLEASGIAKYQWRRAIDDPVTGWTDTVNTYATGVSAYQIGENLFYVRTVDNAGNVADGYSQIRYLWSGNAPPAPTNLEVVQNDEAGNIQRFRWKAPTHDEAIQEYRYAVNVADMNENNTVSVDPTPDGSGWIYTPVGSYGTQQGTNTFRVVAKDVLNQVNYTYFAPIEFNVSTPGPGFPTAPVISDISNMDTSKWALALSWDAPSSGGTQVASYAIQRTTTPADDNSWADLATTISTVYADNYQLNNTTTYYYRILSVDNAAKRSTPSDVISRMPTGKYSTKPAIVTGPAASTTATSATITWSTGREATSFVKYGVGSFGSSVGSNTLATTHSVALAGLNPGTTYTYKVQSFDEQREYNINDESSWSPTITFSTQAAPGISDVKISDIRLDSAIITWKTTSSATSTLKYGKSNSYGKEISDSSGSAVTTHTVKLSGLDNSSTYHFKIFGTDTDGNQMQSDDYNFDTLTFPRVSNVKFDQIKNTATSTLKVAWDSNVPISSTVRYTDPTGKTIEASQSQLVTKHEMVVSGLKDNTEYSMAVSGRDAYGNEGTSGSEKVKTDFDTRPPAISEITTETSINGYGTDAKTQMIVSWNTDEPSTSQVEYAKGVSGDTFSLATQEDTNLTTSHVVVVSDLDPSSSYYFRVVSKDNSKNEAKSETNSALTEQARSSVFDIVLKSFESTLGWLFGGR
ncbi:MAG: DUF2341 domain-containing protein [bacterium]|nr:DUF2341 domain-containing protein [bacterium]